MITRKNINRLIILTFMGLVGYSLAYGIRVGSVFGILLALISLGAGIYFLYLLAKAKEQMEQEQEEAA